MTMKKMTHTTIIRVKLGVGMLSIFFLNPNSLYMLRLSIGEVSPHLRLSLLKRADSSECAVPQLHRVDCHSYSLRGHITQIARFFRF
jgi:hypothetical protein